MDGQCNTCGKYLWDPKLFSEVEQLRAEVEAQGIMLAGAANEAACKEQEIASLRAENKRLKTDLRIIADARIFDDDVEVAAWMQSRARAALAAGDE